MDLRPTLADTFVDALLKDIEAHGCVDNSELRARWRTLIVERFVSHSIDLPGHEHVSTHQEGPICQFLAKYPDLEAVIEYVRFALREIWPDVRILLSLKSDPEDCHTCREGQGLHIEFYSKIADHELDNAEGVRHRGWMWSPAEHRERKYNELLIDNGLYAELTGGREDLLHICRGWGDPDEILDTESRLMVEWEEERRKRWG